VCGGASATAPARDEINNADAPCNKINKRTERGANEQDQQQDNQTRNQDQKQDQQVKIDYGGTQLHLDKGPLISRTGKGNSGGNSQGNRSNYTGSRARGRDHAMDSLLTAAQAADRLGTSVRFIRRLVAQRRIPYLKVGRHLRISSDDLDAFIAAGRSKPKAGR